MLDRVETQKLLTLRPKRTYIESPICWQACKAPPMGYQAVPPYVGSRRLQQCLILHAQLRETVCIGDVRVHLSRYTQGHYEQKNYVGA